MPGLSRRAHSAESIQIYRESQAKSWRLESLLRRTMTIAEIREPDSRFRGGIIILLCYDIARRGEPRVPEQLTPVWKHGSKLPSQITGSTYVMIIPAVRLPDAQRVITEVADQFREL
jgi:hypothetical protein